MPLISDELSVWDISFRWAGFDPDKFWFMYPLAVKDNFKLLMSAIHKGEIICNTLCLDKRPQHSKSEPDYYIRTYLDDIYAIKFGHRFNRKLLKWAKLERMWFYEWCSRRGIEPPEFWFPKGWKLDFEVPVGGMPGYHMRHKEPTDENCPVAFSFEWPEEDKEELTSSEDEEYLEDSGNTEHLKLKPNQRARLACQVIAANIWKTDQSISITDMANRSEILDLGGAKPYSFEVVKRWLREVAPPEVSQRVGRPRKENITTIKKSDLEEP